MPNAARIDGPRIPQPRQEEAGPKGGVSQPIEGIVIEPPAEDIPFVRAQRLVATRDVVDMALTDGLTVAESAKLRGYDPESVQKHLMELGGPKAVEQFNEHRIAFEAVEAANVDGLSSAEIDHLAKRAKELGMSDDDMAKAIEEVAGTAAAIRYHMATDGIGAFQLPNHLPIRKNPPWGGPVPPNQPLPHLESPGIRTRGPQRSTTQPVPNAITAPKPSPGG